MFNTRRRVFTLRVLLAVAGAALAAGCGPQASGDAVVGVSAEALTVGDIAQVTVTVSGPGISPDIVHNLVKTSGQWGGIIGGIPAGTGRTFVGRAYDGSNTLIYEGQATGVTILRGATASVLIILQQKTPPDPFSNSAPRIMALVSSASQVEPGQAATLMLTAEDADGDPLSYAWTATGGSLANADTASPTWTAPASDGAYTLSVSVTDGRGGQAGLSLVLSVVHARGNAAINTSFNTWPVVSQVSATPSQVDPGQSSSLDVTAMDPDGDALAYAWADDCGGSFSDASAQSPTWTAPVTAPASGACTVTVTPDDGRGGSTTGSIVVHVGLPPVPNASPVIDLSFQAVDTIDAGGMVTLEVQAHDPEGTAITFTWTASGGTLGAPVTSATQSDVFWIAPAVGGSFTVTAFVQDGGGAQTTQSFNVTVIGPASANVLELRSRISNGDETWRTVDQQFPSDGPEVLGNAVLSADVNADGRKDVVLAFGNTSGVLEIRTKLSNADGTWTSAAQTFSDNASILGGKVMTGDVNGDGKSDVIIPFSNGSGLLEIRTKLSNGNGTWTSASQVFTDSGSILSGTGTAMAGDVNGDGKSDVIIAFADGSGALEIRTKLSNGNGTWSSAVQAFADAAATLLAGNVMTGDVNADGKADVIFTFANGSGVIEIRTELSNGDGTWTSAAQTFSDSASILSGYGKVVMVGDANGDGKSDVIIASAWDLWAGLEIRTKLSNGNGTWSSATQTFGDGGGIFAGKVMAGDVNADGKSDVIFALSNTWTGGGALEIRTKFSNGDGTWTPGGQGFNEYGESLNGTVLPADISGDGKVDLVSAFVSQG